jgi:hypothetical protein
MRKMKKPKIGDYVLVSAYADRNYNDPWCIGDISEYGEDCKGMFYKVCGVDRYYRHCWRINFEEANELMNGYKQLEINKRF